MKFDFRKECDFFMRIAKEMTNLNVDIWIDASEGYIFNNHDIICYVQNTYNIESYNFIPVSVTEFPKIMDNNIKLNINWVDFRKACRWIKNHREQLILMANCKITCMQFVRILRAERNSKLYESILPLNEMSILRKEDSELAFDIWLDEKSSYKLGKHWHRIKIKPKDGNNNTNTWITFMLNGINETPTFENEQDAKQFKGKDIKNLELFIIKNRKLIMNLADNINTWDYFEDHFLPLSKIKSGMTLETSNNKPILYSFSKIRNTNYLIMYTIDEIGTMKFVITDTNDNLLTDFYSMINPNLFKDNKGEYLQAKDFYGNDQYLYINEIKKN